MKNAVCFHCGLQFRIRNVVPKACPYCGKVSRRPPAAATLPAAAPAAVQPEPKPRPERKGWLTARKFVHKMADLFK